MTDSSPNPAAPTPWSELHDHVDGFLENPEDGAIGDWAIGQGPDAPDRLAFRAMLQEIVSGPVASPSILEVGSGSGVEARGLQTTGLLHRVRYRGIDLTPEMVAECRRKFPEITFNVQSVFDLSPTDDASDIVLCRHILEHIDDGLTAIERMCAAAHHLVVISWFIRPTWYPDEAKQEWLDIDVDGARVSFLHHTYDVRRALAHINHYCNVQSCTRVDFDHHGHPCSIWLLATSALGEKWASSFLKATSDDCFLGAVGLREDGSHVSHSRLHEVELAYQQVVEARDWWHARASDLQAALDSSDHDSGDAA